MFEQIMTIQTMPQAVAFLGVCFVIAIAVVAVCRLLAEI